ncbi:metalloregulator ArsR/SmtB family transcription factor [Marispirochaeta aestuarii]|uniref:ArsR/SmtB family transcription factor n=1 Tax=Marispirochaeta aestuarii TaxID=1963862 RepID=UPI0029C985C4|nr:metalloregulator ArsR/SmtB family transcription factor [Marispirochaeta aestuarii]
MTGLQKAAAIFKILSVESRVQILHMLKQRSFCVNALARRLGISQAAVSQHLRVLRDAGVVAADRQGYFVHYRVSPAVLAQWQEVTESLLRLEESGEEYEERIRQRCPRTGT